MSQNNFHFLQKVLSGLVCLALLSSSVVTQAETVNNSSPAEVNPVEVRPLEEAEGNEVDEAGANSEQLVESALGLGAKSARLTTKHQESSIKSYSSLMRQFRALQTGEPSSVVKQFKQISSLSFEQQALETAKQILATDLKTFIATEKTRLTELGVPPARQTAYFARLNKQVEALTKATLLRTLALESQTPSPEIKIPAKPGTFGFNNEEVKLQRLKPSQQKQTRSFSLLALEESELPTLADTQADGQEIILNSEIRGLAAELNNNPVEITNFVRNYITYEPYSGAKKGALGCLREKVCNDTDTASLTIALLRAAGIPARYKKSVIVVSVEQLQSLLGVAETKTAFAAFYWNNVPVFLEAGSSLTDETFSSADFSGVENLILEWTYVEVFYEYDEWGGNVVNELNFSAAESNAQVQAILTTHADFAKKTWIPVDTVFRNYRHTQKEIVHETANFQMENFWRSFFQYQGELSPIAKYIQDLKAATGKDITETQYQSTKEGVQTEFQILPPTLPYFTGSGEGGGSSITEESWSVLPEIRKSQVRITLKKDSDKSTVLSKTFFGSEINNQPIQLAYEGATETDQALIESYGGIHATPAELVKIVPYFSLGFAKQETATALTIGESLILQFEYLEKGSLEHTDEKFSTAGNSEGIYLVLSKVQENVFLDDATDPNQNSKILLEGNAELARQYLLRREQDLQFLEQVLDLEVNTIFSRAVVTQNRILSKVNAVPTTFDFKGLTIDAVTYLNDYSRRGNFATHRKDFHLLWGLQASYDEAELFTEIAGLEAISTVQGLQAAYAKPGTYTVYKIDRRNEAVIDSLSLSANTKANMHTEVQAGSTILTPNKFVNSGNWRGIFYVSLQEDGSGTYAIGEQVQSNGGWTIAFNSEVVEVVDAEKGIIKLRFKQEDSAGQNIFVFAEDERGESKQCFLTQSKLQRLLAEEGFDPLVHGVPCLKETKTFGEEFGGITHTYTLATDGVKFVSPGKYDYWVKEADIFQEIASVAQQFQDGQQYKAKFSTVLGTHLQAFCKDVPWYEKVGEFFGLDFANCADQNQSTIYYSPNANGGSAYLVNSAPAYSIYGGFLDKLGETQYGLKNYPVQQVGFPVGNEVEAETYTGGVFEVEGRQQAFLNGQLYMDSSAVNENYYVPGKIAECHQNPATCGENQSGGTGGWFGFPLADPYRATDGSWYQPFENEKEIHLKADKTVEVKELFFYRCQDEAYADVTDSIKLNWYTTHGLLNGLGDLLEGVTIDIPVLAWGVVKSLGKAFVNPSETLQTAQAIFLELGKLVEEVEWEQVWEAVKDDAPAAMVAAKNELVNTNLCPARASYLEGYIIGSGLGVGKVLQSLKWGKNLPGEIRAAVGTLAAKGKMIFQPVAPLGKSLLKKFPAAQTWLNHWVKKGARWQPNAHHIIPQSFRKSLPGSEYKNLIEELDRLWGGPGKFDLNAAQNGVFLPSGLHTGKHRKEYLKKIHERIDFKLKKGKDQVRQEINTIRNEILESTFERLNDNWLKPQNQDLIEALRDTKNIYH